MDVGVALVVVVIGIGAGFVLGLVVADSQWRNGGGL